jgi:hypothetical protein
LTSPPDTITQVWSQPEAMAMAETPATMEGGGGQGAAGLFISHNHHHRKKNKNTPLFLQIFYRKANYQSSN